MKENESLKGKTIGRYEITQRLGAGGMGEVYLAEDSRLKRKIALKILPAEFTNDAERLQRFEQEALAASSLNHPNILTIYEIGAEGEMNFIATEFVEGETLREFARRENLTLPQILDLAVQTVTALCAAHVNGIVHRDIKPENIMVRSDGIVKVLDFGLAKTVREIDADKSTIVQTTPGLILGTIGYMSPEQARGKPVDARSDLWSFGVVLFETLAGKLPFTGETASDLIASILKSEPAPLPAEIPAGLRGVIYKLLKKEKEDRYQSANNLLADLKNLQREYESDAKNIKRTVEDENERQTISMRKTTVGEAELNSTTASIKSNRLPLILTLLVLLVGTSAVGYYYFLRKPTVIQTPAAAVKIDSLAVLPFENPSPDTEYISDGITESLINSLSSLPDMRIVSRSTAFSFKGSKETPQAIGKTLNVKTILTGKVSQQGDNLIVQADLIDVENNSQIWGNRFNVKMSDMMQVQEQIAAQISDKLQLNINNRQKAQMTKRYTENADAYSEYLKGRFYTLQYTPDGFKKSLEHLNRAVEIDPTYALAYAGIADAYTAASDWILPPREALTKAKAASNKALELDDQLAEAWAAHGHARLHEWDKGAIDDLNKAVALAPNSMTTQLWLGEYYMIFDVEKSVKVFEHAAELDPLSSLPPAFLSLDYYMLRQPQKAIESGKKAQELNPGFFIGYAYLARFYASVGDFKSAENELNKIPAAAVNSFVLGTRGCVYILENKPQDAEKTIAEMKNRAGKEYISPFDLALVYAAQKNRDQTFFWLDKSYEDRAEYLGFIRNIPDFDFLRDDARYQDLMNRIGFTK